MKLDEYPDMVVLYLGMRVRPIRGLARLISLGRTGGSRADVADAVVAETELYPSG